MGAVALSRGGAPPMGERGRGPWPPLSLAPFSFSFLETGCPYRDNRIMAAQNGRVALVYDAFGVFGTTP